MASAGTDTHKFLRYIIFTVFVDYQLTISTLKFTACHIYS